MLYIIFSIVCIFCIYTYIYSNIPFRAPLHTPFQNTFPIPFRTPSHKRRHAGHVSPPHNNYICFVKVFGKGARKGGRKGGRKGLGVPKCRTWSLRSEVSNPCVHMYCFFIQNNMYTILKAILIFLKIVIILCYILHCL